jgi:APA family basic amino acid/polyamine antiporter
MKRRLGLPSAVALVIANMIGVGVFTTSGFTLADLGSREAVVGAWAVGGVVAMLGALSYGALARRIPESGGEYTFLARTIHPLAGFLAGWISLLVGFSAPLAAAALTLEAYLRPLAGAAVVPRWTATAVLLVAGLLHGRRPDEGVRFQNAAVVLKLLGIAAVIGAGLAILPGRGIQAGGAAGAVTPAAFAMSLVWISFSYSGWNAAVYVAGEVQDPERNLSRALWLATGIVTVLYLGLNAVFLYAAPAEQLAGRPEVAAIAAEALGGRPMQLAMSALVALALVTSISSITMAGPRVYARMAEEGVMPRHLRAGDDSPAAAVALQVAVAVALVWLTPLRELLGTIGFTLGLSTAATVAGLLLLRKREGAARVPIPGYPVVPVLFLVVTLGSAGAMVVNASREAVIGIAIVLAAIPVWALTARETRTRPS